MRKFAVAVAPLVACRKQSGPPPPVQQALPREPRPALLLMRAWFWTDQNGKQRAGWAPLDIWRQEFMSHPRAGLAARRAAMSQTIATNKISARIFTG